MTIQNYFLFQLTYSIIELNLHDRTAKFQQNH